MPGLERAGRFDIADIVRAHRAELESRFTLRPEHKRVLTDLAQCRTSALGGHVDRCSDPACGYERPSYNSCRNRHCPKCPALAQRKWLDDQRTRMLDVPYFHVVFTLPSELRALAAFARRQVYDALFHAASRTLVEFGERRDYTLGATLVLHTWTRTLEFHPHVHAIVTGGGMRGASWRVAQASYLFPVHAMAKVFRAKMVERLRALYVHYEFKGFEGFDDPEGFDHLMSKSCKLPWVVYAKPAFRKADHVVRYLGAYTHRIGIANSRLRSVSADAVSFSTKDGGTASMTPVEFLRRFLRHVLPTGFHKIRHVGLHASTEKRALAHAALRTASARPAQKSWQDWLRALTGRDVCACPRCGAPLVSLALPKPRARDSPTERDAA